MESAIKKLFALGALLALTIIGLGCGASNNQTVSSQSGSVFVTGEDAPSLSVVGFNVTIDSITLNNSSTSVTALSTPEAVDFARLMGLRTLLGFNTLAPGTYTSVTFTFENTNPAPVISYVDLSTTPPSVQMMKGSFSQATVTIPFPTGSPLVVSNNGLARLHIDFDVEDSLVRPAARLTAR